MTYLPRRVLAAIDGSEDATLAARAAADLSCRAGAELYLVHVRQRLPVRSSLRGSAYLDRVFEEYAELYREETEQLIRRQVFLARAEGADVSGVYLREGRAAEEITGLAGELAADLVVVGSRGLGALKRLVEGSISERVIRSASCPTLVVRGGEDAWPPNRLVVGDDFSAEARRAGELAAAIGELFGAPTLLVSAYPPVRHYAPTLPPSALMYGDVPRQLEEALKERAAELERRSGARLEVRVASGNPAAVIQGVIEEGDWPTITAVGSRDLGAASRVVLGSVSTGLLRAANGPVLIVPRLRCRTGRTGKPDRRFA